MITCELASAKCGAHNAIDVTFPYSPSDVTRLKEGVSGARWQKATRHWHVPLDLEACYALRRAFGTDLVIGPELKSWAFNETRNVNKLGSLALSMDAEPLERLPMALPTLHEAIWLGPLGKYMTPEEKAAGMTKPGSYQAADVHFLANSPAPLNGNEQGTGKTLEWIAAVWEAGLERGSHLIVCPKAAIDNTWEKELLAWQADAKLSVEVFACVDNREEREAVLSRFLRSTADVKWVIVNPAMVQLKKDPSRTSKKCISVTSAKGQQTACYCNARKGPHEHYVMPFEALERTVWSTVCVDEAHKGSVRNHRSVTSKGIGMLDRTSDGKPCIMTGTPMKKKGGHDIWGLLNWLRPDVFTSSWRFWETYFVIDDNGYGKKVGDLKPGMEDALFRSLQPYMLRRLKKEVAPWLPDKLYVPVDCWMGPKQLKQYTEMEKDGTATFDNGTVDTTSVLAEFTRLKQYANALCKYEAGRMVPIESCKVEAMLEKMEEAGMFDEGETRKQLVFSQSREMINYVSAVLRERGVSVGVISGEVKRSADRQKLVNDFQEGDLRVMCIVTTAGGVSLTLDAADEVHLLDEMWSPDEDAQAEDRAHRVSRIHQVTVFVYRSVGTIDQYVAETKETKRVTHSFIMDVRRQMVSKWRK